MFELSSTPFVPKSMASPDAGGFVVFEGKVRNHNQGRDVVALEYEAYGELAIHEGSVLIAEAIDRFELLAAHVTHRTGRLEVEEVAVVVQVAAPHRHEAFLACEWIIDELKTRVPIWKREIYVDGDSGWIGSDPPGPAAGLFERQASLPEIGPGGQERLRQSSVLIVGVGGLGSGCLPPLVGAGIGRIGIVDPDVVHASNLHRQAIYRADDVGRSKAERAASFAKRLMPNVQIDTYAQMLTAGNVDTLVKSYDIVVDGTDSLEVKFLLNAACKRHSRTFITASIHRFEGHIMAATPEGPCLQCLYPETPVDGCVGTCEENGVLGVLPNLFGALQANEVLKSILGYGEVLSHDLLLMDLRSGVTTRLSRSKREACEGCAGNFQSTGFSRSFAEMEAEFGTFRLIDIRAEGSVPLPAPNKRISPEEVLTDPGTGPILICCYRGVTSLALVQRLRSLGRKDVYSMAGGAESLLR